MHLTPFPRRRTRTVLTVLGVVVLGCGLLASPSSALTGASAPGGTQAVAAARAAVDQARQGREDAERRLARAQAHTAALRAQLGDLDRSDAQLTDELAEARRQVREFAVAAYIDGGRTDMVRASLSPEQAAALSWRTGLVSGQATSASEAADRFDALRAANDPDRVAAAEQLDRAANDEAEARSDLVQASALERDAEATLSETSGRVAAEQAAEAARNTTTTVRPPAPARVAAAPRSRPAQVVRPATTSAAGTGPSTPAIGGATADEAAFLARVRRCESHGNYSIVSSTGRYRGAYQFSVETWRAVGGTGDPAAASPAEQDLRALMLLRLQGKRAWPVCSR